MAWLRNWVVRDFQFMAKDFLPWCWPSDEAAEMAQILNSPSGLFCLTCPPEIWTTPRYPRLLCGKMIMKILIATNGFPRSRTMQADGHCALSPCCPYLVHYSCLNLSDLTLPTYHSSPLAIFYTCSVPPRLQSFA